MSRWEKRALEEVNALIRQANDVFYAALEERYRSVRRFLPDLLKHIRFGFSPAGKGVAASLDWLQLNLPRRKPEDDVPREIVAKAWQNHITREDGSLDMGTYVFCTLDALHARPYAARDVFVAPSWRYADPHIGLLDGAEWLSARPIICRSLGLTVDAKTTLDALSAELDATWYAVAARLPDNPAIQLSENTEGKTGNCPLGALEKLGRAQLVAATACSRGRLDAACRFAGNPVRNRRSYRLH